MQLYYVLCMYFCSLLCTGSCKLTFLKASKKLEGGQEGMFAKVKSKESK